MNLENYSGKIRETDFELTIIVGVFLVGVVLLDFLAGVEAEVEDESDGFRFRLAEDRSSPLAVGDGDI